ncbi:MULTISPECIES: substrate-binding domain-containing protein [unclassified Pseudoalteromonas]|uniref:substrate-binding domain-containing protein n=1 Tax=unclassified Pseudoalteromonas TaxID=194690 RepID=UPI0005A8AF5C|nr:MULTISPECIES: substrate-binding domain-containing protein [unclassified Pseudoalteromonas]
MKSILSIIVSLFLHSNCSIAQDFYFVTKSIEIPFFKKMKQGCISKATELNVNCHFIEMSASNPFLQKNAIKALQTQKVDGLALSVIHSKFHIDSLKYFKENNIPVVTVDADFAKDTHAKVDGLRAAYVGSDNYQLGYNLGKYLLDIVKINHEYCIVSGYKVTDNLNERIKGFKKAIRHSNLLKENARCPLYSLENPESAIKQGFSFIEDFNSDVQSKTLVYMGSWAQINIDKYTNAFEKYKHNIKNQTINIVSIDASKEQIFLLKRGLSSGNLGQSPFEMGEKALETLFNLKQGKKLSSNVIYTKSVLYPSIH